MIIERVMRGASIVEHSGCGDVYRVYMPSGWIHKVTSKMRTNPEEFLVKCIGYSTAKVNTYQQMDAYLDIRLLEGAEEFMDMIRL